MRFGKNGILFLVFIILVSVSTYIRSLGFVYSYSDENVYIYMARQITRGYLPYKDFFLAHPPLFVYLLAIFQFFLGSPFFGSRVCTLTFSILSSFLVFLVSKKFSTGFSSLFAPTLFLFSSYYYTLFDKALGFSVSTFFIMLSLYFYISKKKLFSGLAAGAAILCRLFSVLFLFAVFLDVLFRSLKISKTRVGVRLKKHDITLFVSAMLAVLLVFGVFSIFSDIINQVFLFHMHKQSWPLSSKFQTLWQFLLSVWFVSFPGIFSIFFARDKRFRIVPLSFVIISFGIVFQKIVFMMYFSFLLPFFCIASSYAAFRLFSLNKLFVLVFIPLFGFGIYSQAPSFVPKEHPTVGSIVGFVVSNSLPSDTINGYSTIAPLIAFLSSRDINSNFIDTTNKRFEAGFGELDELVSFLEKDETKFVLCLHNFGVCGLPKFAFYLQQNYTLAKAFFDPFKGTIEVWQSKRTLD